MRRILCATIMAFMLLCQTAFAADIAYEPERDDAVSYSVHSLEGDGMEFTFVKYATKSHKDEYWLRLSTRRPRNKLLHYVTLKIDDEIYRLTAVENPDEKYTYSSLSTVDNSNIGLIGSIARTPARYFIISQELLSKFQSAKNVYLIYDLVTSINNETRLDHDLLKAINTILPLEYDDFNNYWKPRDRNPHK